MHQNMKYDKLKYLYINKIYKQDNWDILFTK